VQTKFSSSVKQTNFLQFHLFHQMNFGKISRVSNVTCSAIICCCVKVILWRISKDMLFDVISNLLAV
jgi:hypothetical protein